MSISSQKLPSSMSGIYTVSEAARLLRISNDKVNRWVKGYTRKNHTTTKFIEPILKGSSEESILLTFWDLIELFYVAEFRRHGVTLQIIRKVAHELQERWDTAFPFASNRLATDGKQLIEKETKIAIDSKQKVFDFIDEFYKQLDFGETGLANQWYPLGKDSLILIDPTISFGAPVTLRSSIRTEVLYRAYLAEGDFSSVADWYEAPIDDVKEAVKFEEEWKRAS